jgi:nucleotide-binding universal stress UspA family protein
MNMLPWKLILSPTDFSEASFEALRRANELAERFGSELLVLYIVPPVPTLPPDPSYAFELPEYEEALQSNAEERLQETVSQYVSDSVKARSMVGYGDAPTEIVRAADEEGADLIVISTHGLTGWRHLVFGSVTGKVVRTSACPVLTIRASGK